MKRTKEWWAKLTSNERQLLVAMERGGYDSDYGAGGFLPDDCSKCDFCGHPMLGRGLCPSCYKEYSKLLKKASSDLQT